MDSFEDLKLSPELVEALAAEGIEHPTPLQAAVVPVALRGNNVVVMAGPGAGVLVATVAPLLDRLEPGAGHPVVLLLTPTRARATEVAESIARLAEAVGHRAAATHGPWVLPERATVLATTATDTLAWLREGRVSLDGVQAVVVDGAASIAAAGDLESVETLLEALSPDAQRLLLALPLTDALESLAERHLKRAVHLPPRAAQDSAPGGPDRGTVRYRVAERDKERLVANLCGELLDDDTRHVALFVRSEDVAADLGDQLALRGFRGGAPGDDSVPLWLTVDDLAGRAAMDDAADGVVAVSVDVPADPDALDRRHGGGRGGVVLVEPRELGHLRDVARRTGYTLVEAPAPARAVSGGTALTAMLEALETALDADSVDLEAYQIVLEPLLARHGSARVAAATLGLLRSRGLPAAAGPSGAGAGAAPATGRAPAPALPAMVKLFVSLGERDGLRTGDLVGAITGEAGIEGSQIGRIDLRDTFSLVEVDAEVAEKVIRSLNGVTVKGRSVRVDLDRAERERGAGRRSGPGGTSGAGGSGGRGGRKPGPGRRPAGGGGRAPDRGPRRT
jgi:ATP-dependent RNA helicase DeaD